MNFNEFKIKHSELIAFFQMIEHDLKLIYAYMHNGDPKKNFMELERTNLGSIIIELETLDNSDGHPYFKRDEYLYLKQIKNIRNYWCHEAYLDFIYERDAFNSTKYKDICLRLVKDHQELNEVHKNINKDLNTIINKFKR